VAVLVLKRATRWLLSIYIYKSRYRGLWIGAQIISICLYPRFFQSQLASCPMTRSELIDKIACNQNHLSYADVEVSVKSLLEQMCEALACGGRIEIRGFGSFSIHAHSPRVGRNPRTGEIVSVPAKRTPHFKPGKELKERVNTLGYT